MLLRFQLVSLSVEHVQRFYAQCRTPPGRQAASLLKGNTLQRGIPYKGKSLLRGNPLEMEIPSNCKSLIEGNPLYSEIPVRSPPRSAGCLANQTRCLVGCHKLLLLLLSLLLQLFLFFFFLNQKHYYCY